LCLYVSPFIQKQRHDLNLTVLRSVLKWRLPKAKLKGGYDIDNEDK
jgi:hypothetical protein